MGAEMAIAMGARTTLGWVLDAQCALARAHHSLVVQWVFQSGNESTRCTLLRYNRALLDWSPIVQHLSLVLHGSVPTASSSTAGSVRGAPASRDSRMLCSISPCRLGVAMDA